MSGVFEVVWVTCIVAAALTAPNVLVHRRGRPVAALSWLLALFAVPPVALAAWWLVGRTHLQRKRRRRRQASETIEAALSRAHPRPEGSLDESEHRSRLAPFLLPSLRDSVFPPTDGNAVELLPDTMAVHRCWDRLIEEAQANLHALFFAWHDDGTGRRVLSALAEKASQGVEVRVLYDAIGCNELPRGFFSSLVDAGGLVAEFMPIRILTARPMVNFRNHRKLLIADGRRAYSGGVNVSDEYLGWQDIGIEVRGPSVNALQEVFVDDWYFTTSEELTSEQYFPHIAPDRLAGDVGGAVCETIASGPDQTFNAMREMLFLAIGQTRQRLWITTPYFIPDDALLLSLRAAVYRGVDVRLFLPGRSDSTIVRRASKAYYADLLNGGIRVFEHAGMLHAKGILFDDDNVLIGSANLDIRSFRLNFEISSLVESKTLNAELERWFEAISRDSTPMHLESFQKRSYLDQLADSLAHLFSPLL